MWSWRSLVIAFVAVGATAQVLAQDTAQPERRVETPPAPQPGATPPQSQPATAATTQLPEQTGASKSPQSQRTDTAPQAVSGRETQTQGRPGLSPPGPPERLSDGWHRPRFAPRRPQYRPRYSGPDWPLDQSRRFEGPRDAFGGRWIYVRPARGPSPRYGGRYGARYAEHPRRTYDAPGDRSARPYPQPRRHSWSYGQFDRRYGY